MGKLVSGFRDVRASILTTLGFAFGGVGLALLLTKLVFSLDPLLLILGLAVLVVGATSLAIGKFRSKNRLLIYQEGIVQIKWAGLRTEFCFWRDVEEIYLEQEKRYYSGLNYDVRYHCYLRRRDGTWLTLNAIRITASVAKEIQRSAAPPSPQQQEDRTEEAL